MFNWDMLAAILTTIVVGLLAFEVVRSKIANRKLFKRAVQAELDLMAMSEQLNKTILEHNAEKTDGFLRFVSDSRDKAFTYIEEVQAALDIFEQELGPIMRHYKKTGKPVSRKQSETLDKISMVYDLLKSLMPEEDKKDV